MSALSDRTVCISGAVPSLEDLRKHGGSESDLRFAVELLVESILAEGGNVVHGNHPTFTPVLGCVAHRLLGADAPRRVTLFGVRCFYEDADWERFAHRSAGFATVVGVGARGDDKGDAIQRMREQMIPACDAMICIGGMYRPVVGKKQGVQIEAELLLAKRKPVFLVGAFGGAAAEYYQRAFATDPAGLSNNLSPDENAELNGSVTPWEIVDLVMKGLVQRVGRS